MCVRYRQATANNLCFVAKCCDARNREKMRTKGDVLYNRLDGIKLCFRWGDKNCGLRCPMPEIYVYIDCQSSTWNMATWIWSGFIGCLVGKVLVSCSSSSDNEESWNDTHFGWYRINQRSGKKTCLYLYNYLKDIINIKESLKKSREFEKIINEN